MPFLESLSWLAKVDQPQADLDSGAPRYTLNAGSDCGLCFREMAYRNVGGLLWPIFKPVCPSCEPLDSLVSEGAV